MDTLSSLFSKKFKKNPPLLKFHGLNEDLFEGQKLISKRKRTKDRIEKTSPLVEGFASQLSDVDTTEFKRTAHLNETLQKDLSSYATTYRNVLSDYVTAQSESQKCKEDCSSQYPPPGVAGPTPTAAPDVCSSDNLEACTTCQSCYAQGPGWWCSDTGTCSTRGNPCTESCGGGGYQTSAAAESNSLCTNANVERCTTCQSCYAEGPGWWCSDTGTCSTRGNPCMEGCGRGGYQSAAEAIAGKRAEREAAAERVAAEAAAEEEASRELVVNKKQACLAGCGLSKAYLEETNITGSYNDETITECSTLGPQCSNENVEGCTTCEECYAKGPGYWCPNTGTCSTYGNPCTGSCTNICTANNVETCTTCQSCYAQGPGWWCSDTGTCSTRGNPCTESCGGGGLQTSRAIDTILRSGKQLVDSCNKSKNTTQNEQTAEMDGRNLTQEYSELNEKYLRGIGEDPNAELRYMPGYNLGTEGVWGGERLAGSPTGTIKFSDAIEWCRNNDTCRGVTITTASIPGDNDEFDAGSDLFFESSNRGPVFYREAGGWSSWCKGGCDQSAPQTPNILLGDTGGISNRIDNILSNRRGIQTNSRDSRQNLENTLKSYKTEFNKLQNREQDGSTLSAMMSEGKLKKSSASLKYLIWLGLAICMLMIAIRQLKK